MDCNAGCATVMDNSKGKFMGAYISTTKSPAKSLSLSDPVWIRQTLIVISLFTIGLFLVLPLVTVLIEAFAKGWLAYVSSLTHPDALAAMRLTLLTALVSVCLLYTSPSPRDRTRSRMPSSA